MGHQEYLVGVPAIFIRRGREPNPRRLRYPRSRPDRSHAWPAGIRLDPCDAALGEIAQDVRVDLFGAVAVTADERAAMNEQHHRRLPVISYRQEHIDLLPLMRTVGDVSMHGDAVARRLFQDFRERRDHHVDMTSGVRRAISARVRPSAPAAAQGYPASCIRVSVPHFGAEGWRLTWITRSRCMEKRNQY